MSVTAARKTLKEMMKNIIFDYGDVLIKTDCRRVYAPYFKSWDKATWFRENILEPEWISRLDIGDDYASCIAALQKKYPDYSDAIAMYDTRFCDFLVGEMPGMSHVLDALRAEGYHLYGLSNYSHKIYDIQQRVRIFHKLEGQIISSDVHTIKPDRRIFRILLAKYDLTAEESLFIDDRPANISAARALGISTILFPAPTFTRQQILQGFTSGTAVPPEITQFKKMLKEALR